MEWSEVEVEVVDPTRTYRLRGGPFCGDGITKGMETELEDEVEGAGAEANLS